MQTAFSLLAEPHRRRIVELLCDREHTVSELVVALEVSQPAVSKHLRVLRDAAWVQVTVRANQRVYRLDPMQLRTLDEWLTPFRRAWGRRLDALGAYLDAAHPPPSATSRKKTSTRSP